MANDFIVMDSSNESNKEEHAGTTYTSQENHTGMGAGQQYNRYYQMGGGSAPAGKPPFKKKNSGNGVGKKVMAVIAGGLVFGLVAGGKLFLRRGKLQSAGGYSGYGAISGRAVRGKE